MERFQEDPVRMFRAVALAERLGFTLDDDVERAIDELGSHIRLSAPARLMEEYFKMLRSGAAEASFQGLARAGLIEHISPEMEEGLSEEFFESLERLDAFRKRFAEVPDSLTTHHSGGLAPGPARSDGRGTSALRRQRAMVSGARTAARAAQGRRAPRTGAGAAAEAAGHRGALARTACADARAASSATR